MKKNKKENLGNNNRFTGLAAWCPRCADNVIVRKFIVNWGNFPHLLATFDCPSCTDVVQVFVQGESLDNAGPRPLSVQERSATSLHVKALPFKRKKKK